MVANVYASKAHLRRLQRRVKVVWRAEKAKDMILGSLRHATETAPIAG